MSTQTELDRAVSRPWSVYKTPEAVLADRRLDSAQKRRILESWERDARELAVAEEENMGGGEPDMLGRVLEALSTLPAVDERPRGPGTKHGAQPTSASAPADEAPTLTGKEARQGEIILDSPARRGIFIAGLVGAAVLVLVGLYFAWP
jgi:hypothetical protein